MSKIRRCIGFDENVVLAIKSCFYDYDMREIWIKQNESKAVYHSRTCREQFGDDEEILEKVSTSCRVWFNSLTDKEDWRTEESKTNEAELDDPITTTTDTEPSEAVEASKNQETEAISSHLKKITQQNSKLEFSCSFCSKVFRLKSSLDKHKTRSHRTLIQEQRRHQGGQFFCSFCGLGFDKKPSMQRHISRKHSEEGSDGLVGVDVTVSNPVSCSQPGCSHVMHNSSEYKSHLRNVHNLTRRGRRPKEPLDLELARLLGLDESMTDVEYERPQHCTHCRKLINSRLKMYWHIHRTHSQTTRECSICGMQVKKLADHIRKQHTQREQRKFVCEYCGESFKGNSGYQFHLAGHTGEKKYVCRNCGKHFRTSSEAYNCERGHQGIYKWRCADCPFKSHQKNKYIRHIRIHTKSEPFLCPLCQHRTARKDYLQKHIQKVHCNKGLSLHDVEVMYPYMYNIDEKLNIKPPMSYSKLELRHTTDLQNVDIMSNQNVHYQITHQGLTNHKNIQVEASGVQDTGVHAQYCAKDEHVHNLITIQKYQEKEIRGQNIQDTDEALNLQRYERGEDYHRFSADLDSTS